MKNYLIIGLKITFVTLILFGIVYPLAIVGLAKVMATNSGKGEVVVYKGKVIGFELIGQKFDNDRYFSSRPSAVDYNAAATGGSNKGPSNPDYLKQVNARIDDFLLQNPTIKRSDIPVDLVTASGSGVDPHISPKAARIQIDRIARARKIDRDKLSALVEKYTTYPILGAPNVHVLHLNLALDEMK